MPVATLRIVKAPQNWKCQCGDTIEASQECAKIGSQVLCLKCLLAGLPTRPAPKPLTKAQRLIKEAKYLAWDELSNLTHFVEGNDDLLLEILKRYIYQIGNELGLRAMPYHGRSANAYEGITTRQLDTMVTVYGEFVQSLEGVV